MIAKLVRRGIIRQLRVYLGCSEVAKRNGKQHFCLNCLQGLPTEISRDKHFKYCKDNETVRIEMPREGSLVKFRNGQNQFKVSFIMYADFQAILDPIQASNPNPESSYTKSY